MIDAANSGGATALDDPRGRLLWIIPLAIAIWFGILAGFARVLEQSAPAPPEPTTIEAQIVELPPQSGSGAAAPAAPAAPRHAVVRPAPIVRPRPTPRHRQIVRPRPPAPSGTAKSVAPPQPAPPAANSAPAGGAAAPANPGAPGAVGGGPGLGGDAAGARAIFAPTPAIPDDLRQDAINAVAIAHFIVKADGSDEVVLSQPTMNPELNQILINTLKQWRFFPAIRKGVAIDSEFDVRIPVTVR